MLETKILVKWISHENMAVPIHIRYIKLKVLEAEL